MNDKRILEEYYDRGRSDGIDHAVTIDEFKTIYEIFKHYEGLGVLEMNE